MSHTQYYEEEDIPIPEPYQDNPFSPCTRPSPVPPDIPWPRKLRKWVRRHRLVLLCFWFGIFWCALAIAMIILYSSMVDYSSDYQYVTTPKPNIKIHPDIGFVRLDNLTKRSVVKREVRTLQVPVVETENVTKSEDDDEQNSKGTVVKYDTELVDINKAKSADVSELKVNNHRIIALRKKGTYGRQTRTIQNKGKKLVSKRTMKYGQPRGRKVQRWVRKYLKRVVHKHVKNKRNKNRRHPTSS